jgi:predicted lipoprotein with Yx(FWY)xxD motif
MASGACDVNTSRMTPVGGEKSGARAPGPRRRSRRSPAHPTRPGPGRAGLAAGTPRLVRVSRIAFGVAALALLAAACTGGGGGYGSAGTDPYGAAATMSSDPRPAAVVDVRASALGRTLVDGQGRTLYLFEADRAGRSECNGGCATAWPPYLGGGNPQAGTGVTGSLLGTTSRGDGGTQVTYGGHPLYHYAGDAGPGDDAGEGLDQFGAKWFVLGPDGAKIEAA